MTGCQSQSLNTVVFWSLLSEICPCDVIPYQSLLSIGGAYLRSVHLTDYHFTWTIDPIALYDYLASGIFTEVLHTLTELHRSYTKEHFIIAETEKNHNKFWKL